MERLGNPHREGDHEGSGLSCVPWPGHPWQRVLSKCVSTLSNSRGGGEVGDGGKKTSSWSQWEDMLRILQKREWVK